MKNTIENYFSIKDAINCEIHGDKVFIIANERLNYNKHIGRYYTVFSSFNCFLKLRDQYPNCHEILIDHKNNIPDNMGRLVFDFDIKKTENIPEDFKIQIENIIVDVVERYFRNVDSNKLEFIWSSSKNPNKFSKHLTVKNLYFDDWISLSKTFYRLFCIVWDETFSWIKSQKLIDFQIVRKRASLRMVNSSKINGYPLIFDNQNHTLVDSLIRIYQEKIKEKEQLVTNNNIIDSVFSNVLGYEEPDEDTAIPINISSSIRPIEKPLYDVKIYDMAFNIYQEINPGVFKMGKINGNILSLIRKTPSKCILSGRLHEHENAFIKIKKDGAQYSIRFGCNRFCSKTREICIGSITTENLMVMINTDLKISGKSKK